ncbi:MAG: STAS/SEC14 domain-containing protein [Patescibacteria group bacterium]|nr:STAS/SEC14 domain-containing protein [Patescibacteria group bacterium]
MENFEIEDRDSYIYVKFSSKLDKGEITKAGEAAKKIIATKPNINVLIDDTAIRYKDLSAANKLESIEALRVIHKQPRTAAVIAPEDDKLVYYAQFALTYAKIKKMKITHDLDEAIAWVSGKTSE